MQPSGTCLEILSMENMARKKIATAFIVADLLFWDGLQAELHSRLCGRIDGNQDNSILDPLKKPPRYHLIDFRSISWWQARHNIHAGCERISENSWHSRMSYEADMAKGFFQDRNGNSVAKAGIRALSVVLNRFRSFGSRPRDLHSINTSCQGWKISTNSLFAYHR